MSSTEHFEDLMADDDDELIVIDFDEMEAEASDRPDPRDGDYPGFQDWIKDRGLRLIDAQIHAERLSRWAVRPRFLMVSIVRAEQFPLIARTLESLERQLYKDWTIVFISDQEEPSPVFQQSDCLGWIHLSSLSDQPSLIALYNKIPDLLGADWVAFLPAGFEIEENALLVLGDYTNSRPECVAIYTDDYRSNGAGTYSRPRFKPDFDIDYFLAYDYIGPSTWLKTSALKSVGGLAELDAACLFESLLRLWEVFGDSGIGHVDEPLVRLPDKPPQADLDNPMYDAAVTAHIERTGGGAQIQRGFLPAVRRLAYPCTGRAHVTIIVPTRDKVEFLAECINTLFEKTTYPNFDVLVVDNQSVDPDTHTWFSEAREQYGDKLRVISWDHDFNFAAINNFAVANTNSEFICLLNNDTEIIQSEWLLRLVELGQRSDVGIVGCRLAFPEAAKIQHIGIVSGMGPLGVAEHPFCGALALVDPGPLNMAQVVRNVSAVTAACMLVKRADYLAVGGMDETRLSVLYNDVDLCFKVRATGKRILWTPYCTVVHYTSQSLNTQKNLWQAAEIYDRSLQERRFMLSKWQTIIGRDPFFNKNLCLFEQDYRCTLTYRTSWNFERNERKKILALPLPGGSGIYRYREPLQALSDAGRVQSLIVGESSGKIRFPTAGELLRLKIDSFCLHAAIGDAAENALAECGAVLPNALRIFALDDLVTQIPNKSNLYRNFRRNFREARAKLRLALKHCDRAIVSTAPLADLCHGMISSVVVVPNRLSERWRGQISTRNLGKLPRVGWVGASQHQGDLEILDPVIEALRDEVDFVFMGMATDRIKPCLAEFHDAVPWEQYPAKLASLNLDIALAPLEMVPFNEAKSNLRILECGSVGWPMVCSDIFPFQQDEAPVTRVPNDPEAWIEAIRALAADPDRRAREGDALRQWVLSRYMLTDHLDSWVQAYCG